MVASTPVRSAAWISAALAAAGALAALAFHGERPGAGLGQFQPSGIMVHLPVAQVSAIEVTREGRRWRFERGAEGGWRAAAGSPATATDPGEALESGLRFLHGSAPQRVMAPEELSGTPLAELGLAPPRLVVSVFAGDGAPFVVELGGPNPQGLARYARVAGRGEVVLLNRYVAEAWEKAISP